MRLTTLGQYALRATLIVACRQGNERAVSLQSIAESESISQPYLEQLFQRLRKAGIVISLRGPGGGYRMADKNLDVRVLDIIRAVEEDLELPRCAAFSKEENECLAAWDCACKDVWDGFMTTAEEYFSHISLGQLVQKTLDKQIASGVPIGRLLPKV